MCANAWKCLKILKLNSGIVSNFPIKFHKNFPVQSHWNFQWNYIVISSGITIKLELFHWIFQKLFDHFQKCLVYSLPMESEIHVPQGHFCSSNELSLNSSTAMFTVDSNQSIEISGGPLQKPYKFSQFHFHWGKSSTFIFITQQ